MWGQHLVLIYLLQIDNFEAFIVIHRSKFIDSSYLLVMCEIRKTNFQSDLKLDVKEKLFMKRTFYVFLCIRFFYYFINGHYSLSRREKIK